jgi:hypothetical protein
MICLRVAIERKTKIYFLHKAKTCLLNVGSKYLINRKLQKSNYALLNSTPRRGAVRIASRARQALKPAHQFLHLNAAGLA